VNLARKEKTEGAKYLALAAGAEKK